MIEEGDFGRVATSKVESGSCKVRRLLSRRGRRRAAPLPHENLGGSE